MKEVAGYELQEELGRGGMGVVYRALDPRSGRPVALKLLLGVEAEDLERFAREARAMSDLTHPAILPVLEAGQEQGRPFLVTPLAADSLAARLRQGPLLPARAAALSAQLARGLSHAHQAQILHRDLKPGNVLLDEHDQPCLADFGLARFLAERTMTASGAILGTPSYMSPEQARGERADIRSEVYGLGAILYACLTGRPPFRRASAILTLGAVDGDPLPPVRSLAPGVPPALARICERALAKAPNARYSSALELAAALESWSTEPASSPARTAPIALGLLACAALFALALAQSRAGRPEAASPPQHTTGSPTPSPGLAAAEVQQRARRLLADERSRDALALLEPLLEQPEPSLELLLLAAEAANMSAKSELSLALSERALAQESSSFEAWSWRVRSLIDLSHATQAQQALASAGPHAKTARQQACWHALRALLFCQQSHYPQAQQAARAALELDEDQLLARLTLVNVELSAGRYETVLGDLKRILDEHPNNLEAHWFRAVVYRSTGRSREALEELERCLQVYPTQPSCLAAKAALLLELRQVAEANQVLQALLGLELEGLDREARVAALLNEDFAQEALRALEQLPQQRPTPQAWVHRFVALSLLGRLEEGEQALQQALRLVQREGHEFPAALASDLRTYALELPEAAQAAARSGALDLYAQQLARTPEDDYVRRQRAVVGKQLRRWKEVLADLDHLLAKERDPSNELVRAQALANLGQTQAALDQTQASLKAWPEQRKIRLLAGVLLFRTGDFASARAYLEAVEGCHKDELATQARDVLDQLDQLGR